MNPGYYLLSSLSMDPCSTTEDCFEIAERSWLCRSCGAPRSGTGRVDLALRDSHPAKVPLNFAFATGVGIAQKGFLYFLGEEGVEASMFLGRVFRPDGTLLEDFVSFIGRHRLIVRGTKESMVRRCSKCDRLVYFAMGPHYLYPAPASGVEIFDAGNGGLVVTEEIGRRIKSHGWRQLHCKRIPVLSEPRDGLGDLEAIATIELTRGA